jgi:FkbM family methyltransferase
MRLALFYDPGLLLERLSSASTRRRRLARLRRTVAHNLKSGHIESLELLELLRSRAPNIIYDIGANVGTWTLLARAVFPDAEIHAFEPLRDHCKKFSEMTRELARVHLHRTGLGSKMGNHVINVTSFSDASSLLPPAKPSHELGIETVNQENVLLTRLDDYVAQNLLPKPDLIKLDIQGYELEAMKGAVACFQHAHSVLIEVSFKEFYEGQCLFHEIVEFCAAQGFYLSGFAKNTLVGKRIEQTDVLFEKKSNHGRI